MATRSSLPSDCVKVGEADTLIVKGGLPYLREEWICPGFVRQVTETLAITEKQRVALEAVEASRPKTTEFIDGGGVFGAKTALEVSRLLNDRRVLPRGVRDRRATETEVSLGIRQNGERRTGGPLQSFVDEAKMFLVSTGGKIVLGTAFLFVGLGAFQRAARRA